MKGYKYNESKYAEIIYKNGFKTKFFATDIKLIALYMRTILGLKAKERTEQLYKFCEKHIPNYNKVKYFKIIDSALKYASKKKVNFVSIPHIEVLEGEVAYISSLDINYNCKKVLFAFLVQKKLDNITYFLRNGEQSNSIYFKGGKNKYNNIKQMACIPSEVKLHDDIIHELDEKELIHIKYNGLITLDFINDCKQTGEAAIDIVDYNDYSNVGLYFDYYNKIHKVALCKYCGQPFKQTRYDLAYCKDHKGYQPIDTKIIVCVDCGKEVEVDARNMTKTRCDECYKKYRKEYYRQNKQKQRSNIV